MKHSITEWAIASSPNYETNVDKKYPYAEVPYIGNYKLIKIPQEGLIDHVDYWGEGRIKAPEGVSGFPDCYNVNHQYQLVSNGPDRDTKIPNRIPVISYTNCNTSSYIKNDSVKLVTLMGAPINKSCARDIARMINAKEGKVVILGFNKDSADVRNLNEELEKKGIYHCPGYEVSDELKKLTLYESHRVYLNLSDLLNMITKNVEAGKYDNAVGLTKTVKTSGQQYILKQMVDSMLKDGTQNFLQYAYTLWNDANGKDLVNNYFPFSITLILEGKTVKIYDKKYMLALKADVNINKDSERYAWGDSKDKHSNRIKWQFHAKIVNGVLYFQILNLEFNVYLKSSSNNYSDVVTTIRSEATSNDTDKLWVVLPKNVKDDILCLIEKPGTNSMLQLDDKLDSYQDRYLLCKINNDYNNTNDFGWFVDEVK